MVQSILSGRRSRDTLLARHERRYEIRITGIGPREVISKHSLP